MTKIDRINKNRENKRYNIVIKEQAMPMPKRGYDNVELIHFCIDHIVFETESGILIIPTQDLVAMYPIAEKKPITEVEYMYIDAGRRDATIYTDGKVYHIGGCDNPGVRVEQVVGDLTSKKPNVEIVVEGYGFGDSIRHQLDISGFKNVKKGTVKRV